MAPGEDGPFGPNRYGIGPINFKCVSRSTGLTCTNRRGHGWWLGRYRGYRLF